MPFLHLLLTEKVDELFNNVQMISVSESLQCVSRANDSSFAFLQHHLSIESTISNHFREVNIGSMLEPFS